MRQIYNRISVLSIQCHSWPGIKKVDFSTFGVDKAILSRFRNTIVAGGVKLMSDHYTKVFHREFQKLRSFPTTLTIAHKFSKTSTDWAVNTEALPAFHEAWAERLESFKSERREFKRHYLEMQEEVLATHRQMFEVIFERCPELGDNFVETTMTALRAAYPPHKEINEIFYAELVPSPMMALFDDCPVIVGHNSDLEAMGSEMRKKYIELAKLDSAIISAAHQQAWRSSIIESLATLKAKASSEEADELTGRTIASVRLFLSRHPLSEYFEEDRLRTMMEELYELLPDGNERPYTDIDKTAVIVLIQQIEREIKRSSGTVKQVKRDAEVARRKIRVF